MHFVIGLGLSGILIVLIFFVKLRSLSPYLRMAVIGIRIILALSILLFIYLLNGFEDKRGRDLFGNLVLSEKNIIGQWRAYYFFQVGTEFNTTFSFYPDGTFYSNKCRCKGKWIYNEKNETLYLHYQSVTNKFSFSTFDGVKIGTTDNGEFIKINDTPASQDDIKKIEALNKQEEEEKENNKKELYSKIEGRWSLKLVRSNGSLTDDLGIYILKNNGSGIFNDKTNITYKLDLNKQTFTVSRPDEVIFLNIISYDGTVLIGHPNEEPENKYVFSKSL